MNQTQISRQPNEVNMFSLYSHLADHVNAVTKGKGVNGVVFRFLEEQVDDALKKQGIQPQDLRNARDYISQANWVVKHEDGYGVTRQGLAGYHARLRRV